MIIDYDGSQTISRVFILIAQVYSVRLSVTIHHDESKLRDAFAYSSGCCCCLYVRETFLYWNMPSSSSLQHAAKGGRFETCFAKGLDLSELQSSTSSASLPPRTSHAAQLLHIKQREQQEAQKQVQQDECLQRVVQERVQEFQDHRRGDTDKKSAEPLKAPHPRSRHQLSSSPSFFAKKSVSSRELPGNGVVFNTVVVGMHQGDVNVKEAKSRKLRPAKKSRKLKYRRR